MPEIRYLCTMIGEVPVVTAPAEIDIRDGRELSVAEAIGRGHVSMVLRGKKLRGGYSLTRMRRGGKLGLAAGQEGRRVRRR